MLFSGPLAPPEPDSIVIDNLPIERISNPEIRYGNFLLNSSFINSSTAGLNFAPSRDFSEAPFWNPASIFLYPVKANISGSTNWRNQLKLTSFIKFDERIGLSIGFLDSYQREQRKIFSSEIATGEEPNMMFRLNEYALFSSVSFYFLKSIGIGITGKFIKQKFDNHQLIQRTREYSDGMVKNITYDIINNQYKHSQYDMDISFSYALLKSLNLGLNFMNLFNSSLVNGNFLENESVNEINQFAIGSGLSFKYHRLNIGSDILFYKNNIYNVSFGLNFVPFNKALIQTSLSTKEMGYSISFRYGRFKISYINNRNSLIMQSKDSSRTIEKPYLYSSFVIDL